MQWIRRRFASLLASMGGRSVRFVANLFVWLCFFGAALGLQRYDNAFSGEFGSYPDEAAHYVTGLMFHDYFASLHFFSPVQFAENFYMHYPKVGIGHWPPFFYVLQGVWTLIFSTSRSSLMFLMAALAALFAFVLYIMLKEKFGGAASFAAGIVLLASPAVQAQSAMVMADIPVALFSLLAAMSFGRFLDTECSLDVVGFGVFSAIAIMTKGSAFALGLLPLIAIPLSGKWRLFQRLSLWGSAGIVLAVCGPWYWFTRRMQTGAWNGANPVMKYSLAAVPFYLGQSVKIMGWGLLILAAIGIVIVFRQLVRSPEEPEKPEKNGMWAALIGLFAGVVMLLCIIPTGLEDRYLLPAIPLAVAFAVAGAKHVVSKVSPKRLQPAATAALLIIVFVGTGLSFPRTRPHGYRTVARTLVSSPQLRHSVILICSDADGEGMLVSEIAMLDHRPDHVVLRAGEVLARSDWNGSNYRLLLTSTSQIRGYMDSIPVSAVVIDGSVPNSSLEAHQTLLQKTIASDAAEWKLLGMYPVWRAGIEHPDSLDVYVFIGHTETARGVIHINMKRMLGRTLTLNLATNKSQN